MAFRSHPQIQEILRGGRALDVGDVLTHILIGTGDRREAGRSVGAGVAEVLDQLTGAGVGRGLFRTGGQLAQPVVLAGLVGQGRHIGCLDGVLIRFVGLVAAAAAAVVMVTSLIGVVVLPAAVLAAAGPAVLGLAVIAGLLVRDLHRTAVLGGGGRGDHRVLIAGIRPRPGSGLRQVIVLPAGILGGRGILLGGIHRGFRCVFVVIDRFVGRFFLHRLGHARRGCRIRLIVRPEGQTGSNAHAQKGGSGQNRNNRFDIHGIPLFPAFAAVMIFRNGLDIVFAEHDISSLLPVASIQNGIGLFGEGPVFRPSDYLLGTGKSASSRGEKVFFNVFFGRLLVSARTILIDADFGGSSLSKRKKTKKAPAAVFPQKRELVSYFKVTGTSLPRGKCGAGGRRTGHRRSLGNDLGGIHPADGVVRHPGGHPLIFKVYRIFVQLIVHAKLRRIHLCIAVAVHDQVIDVNAAADPRCRSRSGRQWEQSRSPPCTR